MAWRVKDIAEQYAVTRQTVHNWAKLPGFPKPNKVGPREWDADAVKAWKQGQAHPRQGRRARAPGIFLETGSVSQVARSLGVSRRTARRWLVDLGYLTREEAQDGRST